jgi:hypothetical protein
MYITFKTYNLNTNFGRPNIRIRVCLGGGLTIYIKILLKILDQNNKKEMI